MNHFKNQMTTLVSSETSDNSRKRCLVPRELTPKPHNQPLRIKQRAKNQKQVGCQERLSKFTIQAVSESPTYLRMVESRQACEVVARGLIQIAQIDQDIQELKTSMVKHRDFDCYRYFRYLSNFTSSVTSAIMKAVVDQHQHIHSDLSEIQSIMNNHAWTYSDFLKFLYPTSEHLSTLLLQNFKTKERPLSARVCGSMKYDFKRFDAKLGEIM